MLKPRIQLADSDTVENIIQASQEWRNGIRCNHYQSIAQVQYVALGTLGDLAEGLGAVGQKPGCVPQSNLGQTLA